MFGPNINIGIVPKFKTAAVVTFDTDVQAFITAASITNPTQQTALNTLIVGLKTNNLWTRVKALYPMLGGTASSHKFNIKNPIDSDGAFRIIFNGGWTHSVLGAKPNGTNAYGNTFITPSVNLNLGSSAGIYLSSQPSPTSGDKWLWGADNVSLDQTYGMEVGANPNPSIYYHQNGISGQYGYTPVTSMAAFKGFFQGGGDGSLRRSFWNATQGPSETQPGTRPTIPIWLGALNFQNTYYTGTSGDISLFYVADYYSDSETQTFNTLVQAYQTALGRNA